MTTRKKLTIHPAAEAFPMMSRAELRDLADDIAANGLREPIKLFHGDVLDGRNRLAACKLAKVEPTFVDLPDDTDPIAYVVSLNATRRHMTKGAVAMTVVKLRASVQVETTYTDTEQLASESDVSATTYRVAAFVFRWAPDLADKVMRGTLGLDSAREQARKRRHEQLSEEKQLEVLAERHPDLADLVRDDTLSLKQATTTARDREDQEAKRRKVDTAFIDEHVGALAFMRGEAEHLAVSYAQIYAGSLTPGDAEIAMTFCAAFARALKERAADAA